MVLSLKLAMSNLSLSSFGQGLLPDRQGRRYLARAVLLAVVLRLTLFGLIYIYDRAVLQHTHPLMALFDENLRHWDGRHYLSLAEHGYSNRGDDIFLLVFFPLYPWLIRPLGLLLHNYLAGGLLISLIAAILSGYWLQRLLQQRGFDEDTIFRALMFFSCLPGAIYTVLPYTEALFLALSLGCFVAAERHHWLRAGLAGALASATRTTGVLLLPALVAQLLRSPERRSLRPLWLLLIPLGLVVYLLLNWQVSGAPLTFMRLQAEHWNQTLIPPWTQVIDTVKAIFSLEPGRHRFVYFEARLFALVAGLVLLIGGLRQKLPVSWQLYAWLSFALFFCAREAISLPRYLYGLFPIYVVLANWTRRPIVFQAALYASTLLLAGWFVIFMTGSGAM